MSRTAPPPNLLLTLIITLLTPMFLCAGGPDIALARQAAAETVNAYRARDPVSLFTIAKIIAFEFATLSSLSLSMADDVSLSLTLRLRGNANSMDRAAERNQLALEQHRIPAGATHLTEDSVAASVAEVQTLIQQSRASLQAASQPAAPPAATRPVARRCCASGRCAVLSPPHGRRRTPHRLGTSHGRRRRRIHRRTGHALAGRTRQGDDARQHPDPKRRRPGLRPASRRPGLRPLTDLKPPPSAAEATARPPRAAPPPPAAASAPACPHPPVPPAAG
jgi:hypothetical protein